MEFQAEVEFGEKEIVLNFLAPYNKLQVMNSQTSILQEGQGIERECFLL